MEHIAETKVLLGTGYDRIRQIKRIARTRYLALEEMYWKAQSEIATLKAEAVTLRADYDDLKAVRKVVAKAS
tara:strand:- start:568 stop:783 length:216 start_codon:yes stop_codon:yes gene_type:complete